MNPQGMEIAWVSYVERHPRGTLRHLPLWRDLLLSCYPHRPHYLFAFGDDGEMCGLLPLMQVKSWLTGNRLVSLPFWQDCGPIGDSPGIEQHLVAEAERLRQTLGCTYGEYRMRHPGLSGLEENRYYSTYVLPLSAADSVWHMLDPKSVRWAIRKSERDGVTVRLGEGFKDVDAFCGINERTKKRLGVPWPARSYFATLHERVGSGFKLYLAEYKGELVAGAIVLRYKSTLEYAYAASEKDSLQVKPNHLVLWRAIVDGCSDGFRLADLGRTSPDNQGLASFKRHWGTVETPLSYYFQPAMSRPMALNRRGLKYRGATAVWKHLPMSLARSVGPRAFATLD